MPEFRNPGPVALLGSGETSPVGGRVFEALASRLGAGTPLHVAVLETPAGFEPNSPRVAGSVADFLRRRLEGRRPEVEVVPARKRGTPFSPDDPALLRGLLRANLLFLGPGSPTYAVRQLRGSFAWDALLARHRLGAATVLASAAMVAAGKDALPVYEIYKAGEDLHWKEGLDFFGPYGLSLAFVPHWNNRDGGDKLDTSRCFMGRERFGALRAMLPPGRTIVGVDENTAMVVDFPAGQAEVMGTGTVTVVREGLETEFAAGRRFDLSLLGPFRAAGGRGTIRPEAWEAAVAADAPERGGSPVLPPAEVTALADERMGARSARDWAKSDELRDRIRALGWVVSDGPEGQSIERSRPG